MPSKDHYVIIGNGPAGNHAAAVLRKKDADARITIISDECIPYYYKPKLTGFITDNISRKDLLVLSLESYAKNNIRVRLGQQVTRIETDSKTLHFDHMEKIRYTKLIIASGCNSRVLPSMELYEESLKFVTSYTDVMEYKDQIKNAKEFFVFGGDFVGFKFLRMLNAMGKKVTILIYPHAFWPHNLSDAMLDQMVASLEKMNVKVIVRDDIKQIKESHGAYQINTQKGIEKKVDMVFSFNGMIPNINFVMGSGIDCDHGILVDEYLKTNIDNIYACGSCAQIYNPAVKSYTTSIGWPNAVSQGEVVAQNVLGENKVITSVGRKYFDLEGVKIKTTWWKDIDDESQL